MVYVQIYCHGVFVDYEADSKYAWIAAMWLCLFTCYAALPALEPALCVDQAGFELGLSPPAFASWVILDVSYQTLFCVCVCLSVYFEIGF